MKKKGHEKKLSIGVGNDQWIHHTSVLKFLIQCTERKKGSNFDQKSWVILNKKSKSFDQKSSVICGTKFDLGFLVIGEYLSQIDLESWVKI